MVTLWHQNTALGCKNGCCIFEAHTHTHTHTHHTHTHTHIPYACMCTGVHVCTWDLQLSYWFQWFQGSIEFQGCNSIRQSKLEVLVCKFLCDQIQSKCGCEHMCKWIKPFCISCSFIWPCIRNGIRLTCLCTTKIWKLIIKLITQVSSERNYRYNLKKRDWSFQSVVTTYHKK